MAETKEVSVIYADLCPVCGGDLTLEEINKGRCKNTNKKIGMSEIQLKLNEFIKLFKEFVGSKPRTLQLVWAKRILEGDSFAAIAPTGIGKTTFGMVIAIYLASLGKKVYAIVPTTPLVVQFYKRVLEFINKKEMNIRVVCYHSELKSVEKIAAKKNIEEGNFDILITTTQFLTSNFKILSGKIFDFIFVDDVDSLLRASRNVNKVLELLNFSREEIRKATRIPSDGKRYGNLMVSTATGKRGKKLFVLRRLLNFDVGSVIDVVRNIEDIFYGEKNFSNLLEIIKKFGKGCLIYTRTRTEAEEIYEFLKNSGFKVGIVLGESKKCEQLEKFALGELEYLVGTAAPYGVLVRGIDYPKIIRYVVFYGLPVRTYTVEKIRDLPESVLGFLARVILKINIRRKDVDIGKVLDDLEKALSTEASYGIYGDILIKDRQIFIPDVRTYIQGSGRSSRMYSGGITKGASIILESKEIVECFRRRLSIFDINIKNLESVNIEKLIREIDRDRERIGRKLVVKEIYSPVLFIVESPNKARHIASFFGKPSVRIIGKAIAYEIPIGRHIVTIASTLGHLVDLSTSRGFYGVEILEGSRDAKLYVPIYSYIRKCNKCKHQFTDGNHCPICNSNDIYDAREQINILRKLAFECENVIIGTDPDTEGEKIAWDVYLLLKGYGKKFFRAEFHEVTPKAILEAINNTRDFRLNLVKAQIVRRIEDRWIGFELSSALQKSFMDRNMSAGRVQTPPLGWIIERYREKKVKIAEIEDLDLRLEYDKKFDKIRIEVIEEVEKEILPPPPYTTDALLRDANNFLKFSTSKTMRIAQELFEMGWITYHRTDSTTVSEKGLYIAREYLGEKFHGRTYQQEGAHECIRPTRPLKAEELAYMVEGLIHVKIQREHLMLYDLIFRRFMASQMKAAKIRVQRVRVLVDDTEFIEERVVEFKDGFSELYPYGVRVRKKLESGEYIVKPRRRSVRKHGLYTQAELIAEMKNRGIGRPSTYATIVEKLFRRRYVFEKYGRLIPSETGIKVYCFLREHFERFVSESTTRELERLMDEVEKGNIDYQEVLENFYSEIMKIREFTSSLERSKSPDESPLHLPIC